MHVVFNKSSQITWAFRKKNLQSQRYIREPTSMHEIIIFMSIPHLKNVCLVEKRFTTGPSSSFSIGVHICFVSSFVQAISLHLEPLASLNLVYTFCKTRLQPAQAMGECQFPSLAMGSALLWSITDYALLTCSAWSRGVWSISLHAKPCWCTSERVGYGVHIQHSPVLF